MAPFAMVVLSQCVCSNLNSVKTKKCSPSSHSMMHAIHVQIHIEMSGENVCVVEYIYIYIYTHRRCLCVHAWI